MRTRAFNRYKSYCKAKRKQRITEEIYWGGKNIPITTISINIQKIKFIVVAPLVQLKLVIKASADLPTQTIIEILTIAEQICGDSWLWMIQCVMLVIRLPIDE